MPCNLTPAVTHTKVNKPGAERKHKSLGLRSKSDATLAMARSKADGGVGIDPSNVRHPDSWSGIAAEATRRIEGKFQAVFANT